MAWIRSRKATPQEIAVAVILIVVMVLCAAAHLSGWIDFTSPRGTLLVVSLLVLLEQVGCVANFVKHARAGRHRPLPRGTQQTLQNFLIWKLDLLALAGGMYYFGGWSPRDVGLSPVSFPALWFFGGFALYLPLLYGFRLLRFPKGLGRKELRDWFRAMHAFVPRLRKEWMKVWWIVLLNPFTEEFLYRGVLVYMASSFGTPVPLAVLCGAVLCASGHLYQGPRGLWFHMTFYAVAVALLFSPGGLWAAFGFHMAGDVVPTQAVARNFRELRAKRCRTPRVPELRAAV